MPGGNHPRPLHPTGCDCIGKGDVQSALNYNNPQIQAADQNGTLKFTQNRDLLTTYRWTTSDNVEHSLVRTESVARDLKGVSARLNSNGKDGALTGWNVSPTVRGWVYTTTTWTGDDADGNGTVNQADMYKGTDPKVYDGNGDGIPDAPAQQFVFSDVLVNGHPLPNTPVV